ncbi:MAG: T9SS type A sorting domain-containing protein [Bacteroidia bacterium]
MDKKLRNKLKTYAALSAVASLVASNAEAAVVHTNVNTTFGPGDSYDLDLDNGGIMDFSFKNNGTYYTSYGVAALFLMNPNFNGIIGSVGGYGYLYPLNIPSGSYIGSNYWTFYTNYSYGSLNWYGGYGNFIGVTAGFIGLQFDISGNTHYGWVRISCDATGGNWEVIDYAYESTPNVPIVTGDTGSVGVKENKIVDFSITSNDSEIMINLGSDAGEISKVEIFTISGQQLNTITPNSSSATLANIYPKGLYVVRITNNKGDIIRKKIML